MNGAHLHLLLNHLPIIGTMFGVLLLLYAWLRKSEEVNRVALGVFVFTALSAVPAYLTGEPAEEVAEHLPDVTHTLIESHEEAALLALSLALATGVVALAGLVVARRGKLLPSWLLLATVFLASATGVLMARTGNIGGQIRHTEIRPDFSSSPSNMNPGEKPKVEKKEDHD